MTLECTLDAVVILPLALWQWTSLGVVLSGRDWVAAVVLGLVCTAVAYSIWVEGVGRIPVQHSAILGFLTPVVAPLFAWLLAEGGGHAGDRRGRRPHPGRRRARGVVGRPGGGAGAAAVSETPSSPAASGGPAVTTLRRRDPLGYAIVIVSYIGMAGSAPLVAWADAPEAIILCLRMAFAALALGVVFLRRPMIADWRRPGAAWRLLLMAAMSSLTLLLFFYAVRETSVAIAMFLLFLMPVWVALAAPRLFKTPREPLVWPALALALAGLAVILVPDLLGEGVRVSVAGLLAALFTGFGYATYAVSVKGLTRIVGSSTISMAEAALDTLFVLPLALWQFHSTGYELDGRAWIAAVVMGVFCTAIPYTLWIVGTKRVRVEHVTILGYVEPVAGPLFAVFLVGQLPTVWTVIGGAMILAAGLIIVIFGRGEGEESAAAVVEPEPL